ncbi:MAG: acetylxylan esterase, partial [Bacteroidales bacterium]|nr:acetylxylan esterase [Bacteroidales bacterium]
FETADAAGIEREELFRTLSYFDIKNFTDRVTCPVYMAFGLQDPTCPPHTNFAGYNQVRAPKDFHCEPLCGHAMWKERAWQRLRAHFFDHY